MNPCGVHWQTLSRSNRPEVFCKKGLLGNFVKFKGKKSESCNFIEKETLEQVSSCEFDEISKYTFFHRTPLVAASACLDLKLNYIYKSLITQSQYLHQKQWQIISMVTFLRKTIIKQRRLFYWHHYEIHHCIRQYFTWQNHFWTFCNIAPR